ncbi:UDP-N-acetylglucosamine--N-acetylmuramyl-(pentapeptide) pyrophosphoryl-undecaprenol N-acetylglucosamine transferase [Kordia antarctica]|uniref:UDP-N-acetylglucosamine--N-acetylmuramyl-(Pentapeptide) pyrophosphoryl-undecaprenol N-acetylglucosamine transferase n=1 Tax=Kordia antarctica TaxID=1218801 RepID=A0A7L4ZKT2_9FLAO|nr:glycosyltransferase [Kordia antarctica]QHI37121.1 UDP-N-acetylglucosamine--N-acetylmuramyl-(pentapeptide) pyrophosphoryl-undecaprenol N-acetylglucosamine transferase [Kordia antarctica]
MKNSKTVLIAPLNWGLGHATRSIPIIRGLLAHDFTPVIASDGIALALLQKEFPDLETITLPDYQIEYAKKGKNFKLKMLKDSPKLLKAISKEKKMIKKLVKQRDFCGIISDNRFGVYSKKVPSVFVTHQLNVLSGTTTWFSSKIHQLVIRKFDECWIPDVAGKPNLSGKLGHLKNSSLPLKYIGPLSRLLPQELPMVYDLMVILSGPEPQRTILENKLFEEVKHFDGKVLFVRGKVEAKQDDFQFLNCDVYNFMQSDELEKSLNESELVLCRSGYTSVMDLAKLNKKAFFIPTPGQFEQEYLANRLQKKKLAPMATQDDFSIRDLSRASDFKGLSSFNQEADYEALFRLFQRK